MAFVFFVFQIFPFLRIIVTNNIIWGGCPHGVMVKTLDCVESEFKLKLCYYVYFQTNNLGKGMNPLILPAMSKIASLLLF